MTDHEREHYEIARRFDGQFSHLQFVKLYLQIYPDRDPGAIMPHQFCRNRSAYGEVGGRAFLEWVSPGRFVFVGLGETPA